MYIVYTKYTYIYIYVYKYVCINTLYLFLRLLMFKDNTKMVDVYSFLRFKSATIVNLQVNLCQIKIMLSYARREELPALALPTKLPILSRLHCVSNNSCLNTNKTRPRST